MLYSIFRVIVTFGLKIYFRKIELKGLEHITPGKAQILASNHPSGFLEPLLMACFFPRSLYFLVRGDVFENRFLKPVLVATHQLPIYRFKDGFSKLRENKNSMQAASQVLLDKNCILIFVEGSTKSIKLLRPLQKGFIRLASDTQEQNQNLDIEIVPVGINFTDSTRFRSDVMIRIEKPVLTDKNKILSQDPEHGVYTSSLLQSVYLGLQKNVIHLSDQGRLRGMEKAFLLQKIVSGNCHRLKPVFDDKTLLACKKIANGIDIMEEEIYVQFKKDVKSLEKTWGVHRLTLGDLGKKIPSFSMVLIMVLGFVPALTGFLIHLLPLGLAYFFSKSNVKSREFFGSIWFVSSIVTLVLFYLILIISVCLSWFSWYWILVAVATGYFAQYYYDIITCNYWGSKRNFMEFRKKSNQLFQQYFPQ
jgi:1-acyl-sn-glycerol-3-phosphate acyltransferase